MRSSSVGGRWSGGPCGRPLPVGRPLREAPCPSGGSRGRPLPWRQHVIARHAVWGQRLVHGLLEPSPTSPLWIRAARAIFDVAADPPTFTAAPSTTPIPNLHPALSFLTCDPSLLPFGPLHRLRLALNALGPITFPKTLEEGLDTRDRKSVV